MDRLTPQRPIAPAVVSPTNMADKDNKELIGDEGAVPVGEQAQLARVSKILGRTGSRGGVTQVKVQLLQGDRFIIRNVKVCCDTCVTV